MLSARFYHNFLSGYHNEKLYTIFLKFYHGGM